MTKRSVFGRILGTPKVMLFWTKSACFQHWITKTERSARVIIAEMLLNWIRLFARKPDITGLNFHPLGFYWITKTERSARVTIAETLLNWIQLLHEPAMIGLNFILFHLLDFNWITKTERFAGITIAERS